MEESLARDDSHNSRKLNERVNNMRVVIIDDDERKQSRISEVIESSVGNVQCVIDIGRTVSNGVRLLESPCDLLILDINLPLRPDADPVRDGGIRLLKQINRGGPGLVRPTHIIGVTEYPDLAESGQDEFGQDAWQLLYCDPGTDTWEDVVRNKAIHVAAQTESLRRIQLADVAIVTALKDIEFEAVSRLPCPWNRTTIAGDDTIYYTTDWDVGGRKLRIVTAAAAEMGMAASASLVTKLLVHYRPRFLCMAGIAAGIEGNPGDILVADESWDYGSGKITADEKGQLRFRFGAKHIQLDAGLKEKVSHFVRDQKGAIAEIQNSWQGNPQEKLLQVRIGPFASGAAVVENEQVVEGIQDQDRKVIGFDMEAYGVFAAARFAPEPRPKCMVVKSLCDFGVPPKTDEWQRYAAHTSARFVHAFVTQCLAQDELV